MVLVSNYGLMGTQTTTLLQKLIPPEMDVFVVFMSYYILLRFLVNFIQLQESNSDVFILVDNQIETDQMKRLFYHILFCYMSKCIMKLFIDMQ